MRCVFICALGLPLLQNLLRLPLDMSQATSACTCTFTNSYTGSHKYKVKQTRAKPGGQKRHMCKTLRVSNTVKVGVHTPTSTIPMQFQSTRCIRHIMFACPATIGKPAWIFWSVQVPTYWMAATQLKTASGCEACQTCQTFIVLVGIQQSSVFTFRGAIAFETYSWHVILVRRPKWTKNGPRR